MTIRLQNVLKDYPTESMFKEFLQNADDAQAQRFDVILDKRQFFKKESLLTSAMEDLQGPATPPKTHLCENPPRRVSTRVGFGSSSPRLGSWGRS